MIELLCRFLLLAGMLAIGFVTAYNDRNSVRPTNGSSRRR